METNEPSSHKSRHTSPLDASPVENPRVKTSTRVWWTFLDTGRFLHVCQDLIKDRQSRANSPRLWSVTSKWCAAPIALFSQPVCYYTKFQQAHKANKSETIVARGPFKWQERPQRAHLAGERPRDRAFTVISHVIAEWVDVFLLHVHIPTLVYNV